MGIHQSTKKVKAISKVIYYQINDSNKTKDNILGGFLKGELPNWNQNLRRSIKNNMITEHTELSAYLYTNFKIINQTMKSCYIIIRTLTKYIKRLKYVKLIY